MDQLERDCAATYQKMFGEFGLYSGVRQNVGINEAAIETARSARFKPATKGGVRVKTWYRLTIPFKL